MTERVSYRLVLKDDLFAGGFNTDLVGHRTSGTSLMSDAEHCGIPEPLMAGTVLVLQTGVDLKDGYVTPGSVPYLDAFPSDIILLHIGTNDILNGQTSSVDTVTQILDEIDAWKAASLVGTFKCLWPGSSTPSPHPTVSPTSTTTWMS
ncbi:MAG: hypothetical protein R2751_16105 [Bacteroidales bacterium]